MNKVILLITILIARHLTGAGEAKKPIAQATENLGNPLHIAALNNDFKTLIKLISTNELARANINNTNDYNQTPLQVAVINGNIESANVLITAKANVNIKGYNDSTPLHIAAAFGLIDIVNLLINAKADINAQNTDGDTPLHYATSTGSSITAHALIKLGANKGIFNKYKVTPLNIATEYNRIEIIDMLLGKRAL